MRMNLSELKQKALELKEKAVEMKNKTIDYSAKKLSQSHLVIRKKEDLDIIINKSLSTTFTNKETGTSKVYEHKSIVIFAEENSDFFKDALYVFPVLATKAFSQNISLKIAISNIQDLDLNSYNVATLPSLVVFQEKKVINIIEWSENILKLVKSIDLDINKLINNIK